MAITFDASKPGEDLVLWTEGAVVAADEEVTEREGVA